MKSENGSSNLMRYRNKRRKFNSICYEAGDLSQKVKDTSFEKESKLEKTSEKLIHL